MLPLLLFEFVWKTMWLIAFGLPQWFSGVLPPTFAEDFKNIAVGVILMPIVIPWGYVYRHYVKQQGTGGVDRWVARSALKPRHFAASPSRSALACACRGELFTRK
jgi:hypothetical protein